MSDDQPASRHQQPRERALMAAAFEGSDALMLVIGEDGHVVVANPAMTRATGWTMIELIGRPFWEVYVAPEDHDNAQHDFFRAMAGDLHFAVEGDWVDRDGGRRRISMQLDVLVDARGRPHALSVIGIDVTEQRREDHRLRRRADRDALTGLANRSSVLERLRVLLVDDGPGAGVLFCDLDGFKAANDRGGHHVGDLVLVEVARRMRLAAGHRALVGRFGGDEFVVVNPGVDRHELAELAAAVTTAFQQPITLPIPAGTSPAGTAAVARIGVSIGAAYGAAGSTPQEVVRAADHDMYRVKTARRHATHRHATHRQTLATPEP